MRGGGGLVVLSVLLALASRAAARSPEALPPTAALNDTVLTLDRATELALGSSPVIGQARARIDQAQGLAIQAGLYPNPQQNSGNPNQLGGNNSLYSAGFNQEVVRAGKIGLNVGAAEQVVRQANLDMVRQQFEVVTAVRQQFYLLLAAQQRIKTLTELQKLAARSEETSIKLQRGEQVAETDVLLLRIELRRIEVSLKAAEYVRTGAAQQLAAILGLPNLKIEGVIGDLSIKLPNFNDPDVRNQLLVRSSLVETARAEIARTQFVLRRAEVEVIPNLIVNSGYQYATSGNHSQALIGLYFNVPIWDRNQGNIRAAEANVRQSTAQLYTVQNQLLGQLADALARYRSAEITVETYEKGILPDARRTLDLVQRGYQAQQFDFLRTLQTQRSVVEANLDYISALQERLTAAATIAGLLQLRQFP
jgi:outer membrane protein, heavy metal efflux system